MIKCHWCKQELIECDTPWANYQCPDIHSQFFIKNDNSVLYYKLFIDKDNGNCVDRYTIVSHIRHLNIDYAETKIYIKMSKQEMKYSSSISRFKQILCIDQFVDLLLGQDNVIQGYKMFDKIFKLKAFI